MQETLHDRLIEALPSLKAFATALTRDFHAAEDLVQDTAVRTLAKSDQFAAGSNFEAWAFRIMRNQFVDNTRQRRREALTDIGDDRLSDLRAVAPSQEHRLVLGDLQHGIDRLNDPQRAVLRLVAVDGMSYEGAAAACGCPVGTVRSRLARARDELEDALWERPPPRPGAARNGRALS